MPRTTARRLIRSLALVPIRPGAVNDRSPGRIEVAKRDTARLKDYASQLGVDQTGVNQVVDALGRCVAAGTGKESNSG